MKKVARFALDQQGKNPGVGLDLEKVKPFELVYKDDFEYIDCKQDYMLEHADLHGKNKFSYDVGQVYNVSILHYADLVPSEDQEQMTQEVCFKFCRTIPGMGFFGLKGGYDCYCTPFYQ